MDCNQCDSSENVKQFKHFTNGQKEWLCWECRYPIIRERIAHAKEEHRVTDDEPITQTGLFDF